MASRDLGIVTIDGPAASGKSSVARRVAQRLGVPFVSSGMLYRAATLLTLAGGVAPEDEEAVLNELGAHDVSLVPETEGNRVLVDGRDVTAELHTEAVDERVSAVASHRRVRAWVDARLREMAGPFVIEGRDMGTAVFPEAGSKFFLTAPAEIRARRRVGERHADFTTIAEAIRRRDDLDRRQMQPAPDAVRIDTGELTLDEVVDAVLARLRDVAGE